MLNPTRLIRRLEKHLGFKFMDLELSNEEILEEIRDEPLRVFSKYFPNQERVQVNIVDDKVLGHTNWYYLHTDNEIININRVIGGSLMGVNYVTNMMHPIAQNELLGDPISRQLNNDLLSYTSNPLTWNFYQPNIIEILPDHNQVNNYIIVCNVVHNQDFSSISINLEDQFFKYVLADVQASLYAIRTRFANINTAFGNMELYLDQYSNAASVKEELEEKFRQSSTKTGKRKRIYIA